MPAQSGRRTGRPLRVAALLAATATAAAGCGLLHGAAAPAGLEKQISTGERVSTATRQQTAAARLAARHLPAADAHAPAPGVHTPARAADSPARDRRVPAAGAGPAAAGRVTGRQITAVGDSVMLASATALQSVLPGIYIDAQPSRQMPAGLAVLRSLAAAGRLRPVVVVGLGTNYIVTTGELNSLLRLIGPQRRLVLINTYVPDQWSQEVNATMAAFTRAHPQVVLADWYDTIRTRTNLLWPDQVHPELPGTTVYARLVYNAIQATRTRA